MYVELRTSSPSHNEVLHSLCHCFLLIYDLPLILYIFLNFFAWTGSQCFGFSERSLAVRLCVCVCSKYALRAPSTRQLLWVRFIIYLHKRWSLKAIAVERKLYAIFMANIICVCCIFFFGCWIKEIIKDWRKKLTRLEFKTKADQWYLKINELTYMCLSYKT